MPDFSHTLMVTDLDATFFSHPSRLSPRNITAIEYFKAHGGRFTAATGRIPFNIRKAIPTCATLFNAPAITANGAFIYDLSTETLIRAVPMNAERVKEAAAFVQSLNPRVGMRVSLEEGILVNADRLVPAILRDLGVIPESSAAPGKSAYVDENGVLVEGCADPETLQLPAGSNAVLLPVAGWQTEGAAWYKLVFRGEPADLLAIRPLVEAKFGDAFEYNTSSPRFYELQQRGCDKADGLRFVANLFARADGHPIRTIAVGDQENDLPMLRAADIAACPSNATPEVKAIVNYELCHCDDGCIADLITRLAGEPVPF